MAQRKNGAPHPRVARSKTLAEECAAIDTGMYVVPDTPLRASGCRCFRGWGHTRLYLYDRACVAMDNLRIDAFRESVNEGDETMRALRTDEPQRRRMIAEAAYYRAEQRGFEGGDPVADWLEAEAEVDAHLGSAQHGRVLHGLEARLAAVNETLAGLRQRVAEMQTEAAAEWRQDLERLGNLRDSLSRRLNVVRERGEHASEQAQQRAEKIWEEISEILHRFASRREDTDRDA